MSEKLTAWVEHPTAGVYRNLETGLERKFKHTPRRGKWTRIRPLRTFLDVQGNIIHYRRRALEGSDG